MQTDQEPGNRERIAVFLGRIDRRLRGSEALELVPYVLWGLVAVLVTLRITGFWDSPGLRWALVTAFLLGAAGLIVWRSTRERGLARAAAVADAAADLKDSLKSALAFSALDERTDWMTLQIARAADSTETLSPSELVPTVVPKPVYYAAGVSALLLVLFSWNPGWLQELEDVQLLTTSKTEQDEQIEELLDKVEALAPEEEQLEELSDALERLRRRDIELTEALQELSEAQQALEASQAEMERLEMDLEELGAQMESAPALADLSQALKAQNTKEAAELLRQLAERLADAQSSEELQALLESLKNANLQNEELAEMMENLEQSAGEMTAQDLEQMAQALESIADQMENMGQQMAAQVDMEQMGQDMQQLQASLGQQQAGAQQAGQQQQAPGQAQSEAGMMSNQMQMAQMQGDASSAVPVDAGPAGDTTGPGGPGEDQVFGEATTLDVQLEMEVLTTEEKEEPVPEEIFERLSREEKSTLNYEDVAGRGSYAEESAMQRDSVPWQYRSLVKRYFLSILTQTSESTSEP